MLGRSDCFPFLGTRLFMNTSGVWTAELVILLGYLISSYGIEENWNLCLCDV